MRRSKNENLFRKCISVLLIFAFLFTNINIPLGEFGTLKTGSSIAYAATDKGKNENANINSKKPKPDKNNIAELVKDKSEKKENRTGNSKTFIEDKGQETALVFLEDIHYQDEAGTWQDIDNSIVPITNHQDFVSFVTMQKRFGYINQANDFKAIFSTDGSPSAGFIYLDTYLESSPILEKGDTYDFEPITDGNAILYPEIMPGVDLEYHVINSGLKENVILNKYNESLTSITFDLTTKGIKLEQENNHIVAIDNKGNKVYSIAPPYLIDADGNSFDQVEISLTGNGNNYSLTYYLNQEWLSAIDRVYPVKIDPSVVTTSLQDTYAESKYPNTLTYPQEHLYIGLDNSSVSGNGNYLKGETVTYLKFDLPRQLKADAVIESAWLNMYKITDWGNGDRKVSVYPINTSVEIDNITWNSQPGIGAAVGEVTISDDRGQYSWPITSTVQKWVNKTLANNGLAVKYTSNNATTQAEVFASQESSYTQPYIEIKYSAGEVPPPPEEGELPSVYFNITKQSDSDNRITLNGQVYDAQHLEYTLYDQNGNIAESKTIDTEGGFGPIEFPLSLNTKYYFELKPWRIDLIPVLNSEGEPVVNEKTGEPVVEEKLVEGNVVASDELLLYKSQITDNGYTILNHYYGGGLSTSGYPPELAILLDVNKDLRVDEYNRPIVKIAKYILLINPLETSPASPPKLPIVTPVMKQQGRTMSASENTEAVAEPVNPHTGNYFSVQTDFSMETPGLPFSITRAYNTQSDLDYTTAFGNGWSFNYDLRLNFFPDGAVGMTTGDGSTLYFEKHGNSYVSPHGIEGTFKKSGSKYIFEDKYGIFYTFSEAGFIQSMSDRNNNTISMSYNKAGLISGITDTAGRRITVAWNKNRNITAIYLPGGKTLSYGYSGKNLTSFTDLDGNTTRYGYDSQNRLTGITNPKNNTVLTNLYDGQNRVISQTNSEGNATTFSYSNDSEGVPNAVGHTAFTDPEGNTTKYYYDTLSRLVKKVYPENETEQFFYDSEDNRVRYVDPKGNSYSYEYDSTRNLTKVIDPLGNVTSYTYDRFNNIRSVTDSNGKTTSFEYDPKGNLTKLPTPPALSPYWNTTVRVRLPLPSTLSKIKPNISMTKNLILKK